MFSVMVVPSLSQTTVGVAVGDHFQWVGTYSHVTDNPAGMVPAQVSLYAFWNETEYVNRTVTSISGTDVTFDATWHFTNGTADKTETLNWLTNRPPFLFSLFYYSPIIQTSIKTPKNVAFLFPT